MAKNVNNSNKRGVVSGVLEMAQGAASAATVGQWFGISSPAILVTAAASYYELTYDAGLNLGLIAGGGGAMALSSLAGAAVIRLGQKRVVRHAADAAHFSLLNDIDRPLLSLRFPPELLALLVNADGTPREGFDLTPYLTQFVVDDVNSKFLDFYGFKLETIKGANLLTIRRLLSERFIAPLGVEQNEYDETLGECFDKRIIRSLIGQKNASCKVLVKRAGAPVACSIKYNVYNKDYHGPRLRICTELTKRFSLD